MTTASTVRVTAPRPFSREDYVAALDAAPKPPPGVNAGHYKSGLVRMRRVLKAAGVPMGKLIGRYAPFGAQQDIVEGIRVRRVGCGTSVSVHALVREHSNERASDRRWLEVQALTALWAAGFAPEGNACHGFFRFAQGAS